MFETAENKLIFRYDAERLWIEAWGTNSLRVRATCDTQMPEENWALLSSNSQDAQIIIEDDMATITNGNLTAKVTNRGKITMYNSDGKVLLEEFVRNRLNLQSEKCSSLMLDAREFKAIPGGDFHITARFEPLDEKLYGMGQYQQENWDLKGCDIELAHRNSQASVPFAVSSRGYGFLWNNPAIGRAVFGKNLTSFEAMSTKALDYWVTAGNTPSEIVEQYSAVTGTVPMMPEYGLGFWQCKLRYQTQEELLEVAREHKIHRGLPMDVIVVDFFHWPLQGDWRFDSAYWPDPESMVKELKEMGIELMVSIWPTVDRKSENYQEMLEKGLLVRTDRGHRTTFDFMGDTVHYDATNPEARSFLWSLVKKNYYDKGINIFWLDEAEPEYSVYDFDIYRYHLGSNLQVGNLYPLHYAKTFYDGMVASNPENPNVMNLLRCAWAGSQKYGALVWSGDIGSTWSALRSQVSAGLHMGLAGIPWWTTDIGGFHGGDPNDPAFRELFVRWFQWGTFCPVMRLHGDREPRQLGLIGGEDCASGAPNEVWSYGEAVYEICKRYILLRESLRDYTRELMAAAHEKGTPVMRTCFYEFPNDPKCWDINDQYMYGHRYLCVPILHPRQRSRVVYFPFGASWKSLDNDQEYQGGATVEVDCPLEMMPVFIRGD